MKSDKFASIIICQATRPKQFCVFGNQLVRFASAWRTMQDDIQTRQFCGRHTPHNWRNIMYPKHFPQIFNIRWVLSDVSQGLYHDFRTSVSLVCRVCRPATTPNPSHFTAMTKLYIGFEHVRAGNKSISNIVSVSLLGDNNIALFEHFAKLPKS